mgnify:CR=1 FL=1
MASRRAVTTLPSNILSTSGRLIGGTPSTYRELRDQNSGKETDLRSRTLHAAHRSAGCVGADREMGALGLHLFDELVVLHVDGDEVVVSFGVARPEAGSVCSLQRPAGGGDCAAEAGASASSGAPQARCVRLPGAPGKILKPTRFCHGQSGRKISSRNPDGSVSRKAGEQLRSRLLRARAPSVSVRHSWGGRARWQRTLGC